MCGSDRKISAKWQSSNFERKYYWDYREASWGDKTPQKKRVTIQDKVLVRGFWNTEGKRTISKRGSPILHIETADYFQTCVEFLLLLLSSDKRLQAVTKRTSQQMM